MHQQETDVQLSILKTINVNEVLCDILKLLSFK